MGFRTRGCGGYRDNRRAAVYEFGLLQLGCRGLVYVWSVVSDQWLRKLLAALRGWARVVALREWQLVYGSVVWLGVCGFAAVGLAAVSLRWMGIRAGIWLAVGAGTGIRWI